MRKIGFGGGCHWCTEAVFQILKGVIKVDQGWIQSEGKNRHLSEAVIVHFDEAVIDLTTLTSIHLHTHSCTADHAMRNKYRSAVYTFNTEQAAEVSKIIKDQQSEFDRPILPQVLSFVAFKENKEQYQNYYLKNTENSFCKTYIHPKFKLLMNRFASSIQSDLSSKLG